MPDKIDPFELKWIKIVILSIAIATLIILLLHGQLTRITPLFLTLCIIFLLFPYIDQLWAKRVIGLTLLIFVIWFLSQTLSILTPFIFALVVAYLIDPFVTRLQRLKFPRMVAILVLVIPFIALIVVLTVVFIPMLARQLYTFAEKIPSYLNTLQTWIQLLIAELNISGITLDQQSIFDNLMEQGTAVIKQVAIGLINFGRGINALFNLISYLIIVPIIILYLLRDLEKIRQNIKSLIPERYRDNILSFLHEVDSLLGRYFRGKILVCVIVGVLTGCSLALLGMDFALLIGVFAGICNIVPYVGLIISLIFAMIIAVFSGPVLISLLKVIAVFIVVQSLENALISPRILGKTVGLHPVIIILSIFICSYFWGVIGVLVAVPLTAVLKVLTLQLHRQYIKSAWYQGK